MVLKCSHGELTRVLKMSRFLTKICSTIVVLLVLSTSSNVPGAVYGSSREDMLTRNKGRGREVWVSRLPSELETNGVKGFVSLTLTSQPRSIKRNSALIIGQLTLNGDETCFPNGQAQVHMHSFWNLNVTAAGGSDFCGPANTGSHYDPTLACGPASSNNVVCVAGEPYLSPSLEKYFCTPQRYKKNSFYEDTAQVPVTERSLCQIGDYNNKFGNARNTEATPKTNFLFQTRSKTASGRITFKVKDPLQIDSASLHSVARSLVVHCVDGKRAACAEFRLT